MSDEREDGNAAANRAAPRPLGVLGVVACALACVLALANARVAYQVYQVGGMIDPALAGQAVALLAGAAAFAITRTERAGLVLTGLGIWVYWGMAPVIGQVFTGPPAELPLWLGPMEVAAFLFFPLAFFAWRGVVRGGDATKPATGG